MQIKLNNIIKVIKFAADAPFSTGALRDIKSLIEECSDLYPGIDLWFKRKVEPGFKNEERIGLLVYNYEKPIGAAILRHGEDAKLCSLRILPEERKGNLGNLLMSLVANELRTKTNRMHFTISEESWEEFSGFFESYGFVCKGPSKEQYRLFDQELLCRADFGKVWQTVVEKLPRVIENLTINGSSSNWDIVMSIKPEFASRLLSRTKKIEIRKNFSQKWKGARVLFYSSAPDQRFVGEGVIGEIIKERAEKIWEDWKGELGCTYDEFSLYCHSGNEVTAIIFSDVRAFREPIYKTQLEHLIRQDLQPPQSFCSVKSNRRWSPALSLTCLLQSEL